MTPSLVRLKVASAAMVHGTCGGPLELDDVEGPRVRDLAGQALFAAGSRCPGSGGFGRGAFPL